MWWDDLEDGIESWVCFRNALIVGVFLDLAVLGVAVLVFRKIEVFYMGLVVFVSHFLFSLGLYFCRERELTRKEINIVRFGVLAALLLLL